MKGAWSPGHIEWAKKKSISFANEAAYWIAKGFPYSVDFAIEFDKAS